MSLKERKLSVIEVENIENIGAPESVIVRNEKELIKKLEESEKSIRDGNVYSINEVMNSIRKKYNLK